MRRGLLVNSICMTIRIPSGQPTDGTAPQLHGDACGAGRSGDTSEHRGGSAAELPQQPIAPPAPLPAVRHPLGPLSPLLGPLSPLLFTSRDGGCQNFPAVEKAIAGKATRGAPWHYELHPSAVTQLGHRCSIPDFTLSLGRLGAPCSDGSGAVITSALLHFGVGRHRKAPGAKLELCNLMLIDTAPQYKCIASAVCNAVHVCSVPRHPPTGPCRQYRPDYEPLAGHQAPPAQQFDPRGAPPPSGFEASAPPPPATAAARSEPAVPPLKIPKNL